MHSSIHSEWGNICGLEPKDLSNDLLKKIKFEKLLECLELDKRVPHIIASRMLDEDVNAMKYFEKLPKDVVFKFPNIIAMYNRYIEKKAIAINGRSKYDRDKIILWDFLNEGNREKEILRWIGKQSSVINASSVDYNWLFEKHPNTANQLVKKVWENKNKYYYGRWGHNELKHMIHNVPESHLDEVMNEVFKCPKYLQIEALANPNLKEKHTIKALKILAKKTYVPKVRAKITKSILEKLPTITRLEVIEKLIIQNIQIQEIENEDDFKALMFGSIVRYPGRVEAAVIRFRFLRSK